MLNFLNKIRLDQVKEGNAGGGSATETPPVTEEKPATPPSDPPAEEGGNKFDDFGYPIVGEEKPAADDKGDKSKTPEPEKKTEETEVKDPASGYGSEPPKVEDPPAEEKPPEEKKEDPPAEKTELDKVLDTLADFPKEEADVMRDFAKKHNVTPELAKAYIEQRKSELAAAEKHAQDQQKLAERKRQEQRQSWDKELREDPTFGGTNFAKNIQTAERVLNDFMPGLKKKLTESKGMLPPYVMRDLAKLGETLYGTGKLVQGDPPGKGDSQSKEKSFLDDMYT